MATNTWTQAIEHSDDATFRVWGKKISDEFQAMSGLVKTADTGQIDWATVARAGVSTDAGYEVYYLNDSLHGTAPLYFRLDFGTNSVTSRPNLKLTVGTGSNGSGTITGTALTATNPVCSTSPLLTSTYTSYLCVTEGFIGFVGWAGGIGATGNFAPMGFMISRSCNAAGTPDALGALVFGHNVAGSSATNIFNQSLRFTATAAAYTRTNAIDSIFVPGAETTTAVGGDPQAYLAWHITPYMQPVHSVCGVLLSEVSFSATFSATLVGASHTYICMDRAIGEGVFAASVALWGVAMLWE